MNKKLKLFISLILILNFTESHSQIKKENIIGLWQENSPVITSMYLDTYEFLENGKFIFSPTGYNGLNRVISIEGNYQLKNDTLYLLPIFTKELIGGYPIKSMITTLSDAWEIEGGDIIKKPCVKKADRVFFLEICHKEKCIILDGKKFYKIEL